MLDAGDWKPYVTATMVPTWFQHVPTSSNRMATPSCRIFRFVEEGGIVQREALKGGLHVVKFPRLGWKKT